MTSQAAVFLELEGPVLDVSARFYAVHQEIVGQIGGAALDFEEYCRLKRERASLEELAGLDPEGAREYRRRWSLLIEAPHFLELDRYQPQARTAVLLLASSYQVVAVCVRRKSRLLREQLAKLSFPKIAQLLSAAPKGEPSETKARLIQASPYFTRNAVVVGDAEEDIRAGQDLGLTTVAVRAGLRADVMLEGVAELPGALKRLFLAGRP